MTDYTKEEIVEAMDRLGLLGLARYRKKIDKILKNTTTTLTNFELVKKNTKKLSDLKFSTLTLAIRNMMVQDYLANLYKS